MKLGCANFAPTHSQHSWIVDDNLNAGFDRRDTEAIFLGEQTTIRLNDFGFHISGI